MASSVAREDSSAIGTINVNQFYTYVAVHSSIFDEVMRRLATARIKGRGVKLRTLDGAATR